MSYKKTNEKKKKKSMRILNSILVKQHPGLLHSRQTLYHLRPQGSQQQQQQKQVGQCRNQRRNQKIETKKIKTQFPKSMELSKSSSSKREVYSDTRLPQEIKT